jgi:hypothetical protein
MASAKPNTRRAVLGMLTPALRRLHVLKKGWNISMTVYEPYQLPDGRKNYRTRKRSEEEKPENSRMALRLAYIELSTAIEELTLARSFVARRYREITDKGIA